VGQEFLASLEPLLCREWNPTEVRESIVRLRNSAEKQSASHNISAGSESVDVKTGTGGIRDVEFLVQGMQLANAHRKRAVLSGNTLEALRLLTKEGMFPVDVAEDLERDYLFLRRVEHFLQLYEDRQVHSLPDGQKEREALARRIEGKEATAETFMRKLESTRLRVRSIYEEYLGRLAEGKSEAS